MSVSVQYVDQLKESVNALRQAFKTALDEDVEDNITSEIWRHYQGLKSITASAEKEIDPLKGGFKIDCSDPVFAGSGVKGGFSDDIISFNTDTYQAAGMVDFSGTVGADHISLG